MTPRKQMSAETLGQWLAEQLARTGKSKAGLAAALGVGPSEITRILKGKREIKLREAAIIASYVGRKLPVVGYDSSGGRDATFTIPIPRNGQLADGDAIIGRVMVSRSEATVTGLVVSRSRR